MRLSPFIGIVLTAGAAQITRAAELQLATLTETSVGMASPGVSACASVTP